VADFETGSFQRSGNGLAHCRRQGRLVGRPGKRRPQQGKQQAACRKQPSSHHHLLTVLLAVSAASQQYFSSLGKAAGVGRTLAGRWQGRQPSEQASGNAADLCHFYTGHLRLDKDALFCKSCFDIAHR
jgi:hypothetical protein